MYCRCVAEDGGCELRKWSRKDGNPPGRLSWMKQGPECRGERMADDAKLRLDDHCQLATLYIESFHSPIDDEDEKDRLMWDSRGWQWSSHHRTYVS